MLPVSLDCSFLIAPLVFSNVYLLSQPGVCYNNYGSEKVIVIQHQRSNLSAISWREQVNFQWDDDEVRFLLNEHA